MPAMATRKQQNQANRTTDQSPKGGRVVTVVGNLTADPELRFGQASQTPYARMRIAVSTPKVEGNWSGERETNFYDVTAFATLAVNVAECLTKGTRVVVTGREEVRIWTGEDGTEREAKGILADAIAPDLRWATAKVMKSFRPKTTRGSAQAGADGQDS